MVTGKSPLSVTNGEFLTALFGDQAPWVHVTAFAFDPTNIPKNKHLASWMGDYFSRYTIHDHTNQYFTISLFYCDDKNQARRRKALFRQTPVIVLDDVKEKLSLTEVNKLPRPAWILETSQGSEQWGYILDTPCTDRSRVENLLDGLVANGLAPDGRDPGMKGVTRYVRLPEGINNKKSKLVDGLPWRCRMTLWEPFNRSSLEDLATPFMVDLDAIRRESRVDGAAKVSDHPLINIPDTLHIKEVRSAGRFDVRCPWVEEHTGEDDSGSAVFTNTDGSIGFKCHHGACQERNGSDLLRFIENNIPGFNSKLKNWQVTREFMGVSGLSFMDPTAVVTPAVTFMANTAPAESDELTEPDVIGLLCDQLRRARPTTSEARVMAQNILKHVDSLPKIEQKHWHDTVCDLMVWSKTDFREILKDLRRQWYTQKVSSLDFYDKVVFVKELNQFYDHTSRIFFTVEAFQNSYSDQDAEAKKVALQDGRVSKVDRLDYAPLRPRTFIENNICYANTWSDEGQPEGLQGDSTRWSDHFAVLGWADNQDHIEKWMAYTLRHPDKKINHMLLLGSGEGCGKDFLLYPLIKAMGENQDVISGEELLDPFNDYVLSTKYLHVNEAELGDRREALAVSNKLKPLAAAPPDTLSVNQKGIKRIKVRNIVNVTMTTNSVLPLRLNSASRRFYAVWSDLNIRDRDDNVKPGWAEYWEDRWEWMLADGWKHVVHHLIHDVDLSDFKPQGIPPMTEFLRDIRDASKSPMHQTIEAFVEKGHGIFQCDILTASDMSETLRAGVLMPADMMSDAKYFTPKKVGMILREMGSYPMVRGRKSRLWVIRNESKYIGMTAAALDEEYEQQTRDALDVHLNQGGISTTLTVVK